MLLDFHLYELICGISFFVAEGEATMQQDTLWFCAALSVVLIVTSFVDGQEVILLSDTDISPLGQVREPLIFIVSKQF